MSRARPFKRVFELDMERCPNCGGELKSVTASRKTAVIERILEYIGLPPGALASPSMPQAA